MQNLHAYQPQTRERERTLALKRAQTAKEHSQNQSKKTRNENSSTIHARKNATSAKKMQGQLRTPQKNYLQRKTHS